MFRRMLFSVAILGTGLLAGCNRSNQSVTEAGDSNRSQDGQRQLAAPVRFTEVSDETEHAHAAGAHGGTIVSFGGDSYHAELVFGADGSMRLYTLGSDESRVQEIERQQLVGYLKTHNSTESTRFTMDPEPQDGDAPDKTSQFVAQLPEEFRQKPLEITIPSIRIAGERFRLSFKTETESHDADMMPTKVADDDEAGLYLTPGGVYTEADIEANGRLTASQKFDGFMSAHDMNPKPGDRICPVTQTKANPKCSWIVGGKEYEFCCPPCVDEFVRMAKEEPEKVMEPDSYIKR